MLAIGGGKGGCGKTTTTLGLAAALPGSTLAVDADRDMPNLHSLSGVEREPTLADVGSDPVATAQPCSDGDGVSVLPAPPVGSDADVRRGLTRLASAEATVLVDCPAGASVDAAAPLRVADGVLLVSTLCAPGLRDAAKTAAMARALGTPVRGAVLTRTRLAPDRVADLLGCPILAAVPEVDPPVLSAPALRRAYARLASTLDVEEDI
ncbi:MinD/ParA family ATP-binding protein [Halegenticoccus tardaugens]|uniref:MinD/ParA family ATP-binding protein n=1 Tax=Halegenticoccus tardaugens TaxID=2071624 RepID=UPI00100B01F7|nr:CDP-4-keto-6-deoxy-D-glucose-3-dehydrase [Halegenticoccus tardaugens]